MEVTWTRTAGCNYRIIVGGTSGFTDTDGISYGEAQPQGSRQRLATRRPRALTRAIGSSSSVALLGCPALDKSL